MAALWLLPPFLARLLTGSWTDAAAVGDAFGGASSLFSGLALLGVVYTVITQRSHAVREEERLKQQQEAAQAQILQLSLSTQLQSARALTAEHRKAIVELSPGIGEVPTAPSLLRDLRKQIEHDSSTNSLLKKRAPELLQRVDELLALQDEITSIRQQLQALRAVVVSVPDKQHSEGGPN